MEIPVIIDLLKREKWDVPDLGLRRLGPGEKTGVCKFFVGI